MRGLAERERKEIKREKKRKSDFNRETRVFRIYLPDSSPAASRLESEDLTEHGKLMEWNFFFRGSRTVI